MTKIWMPEESSVLQKKRNGSVFTNSNNITPCFLYGLLTFNWCLTTDFKQMRGYLKRKLSYGESKKPEKLWTTLVITKIIYFYLDCIPMIFGIIWWKVLIGFFVMHYTAGLILSLVFQLAHVVEETDNPTPNELDEMENTWAIHQLYTTTNFAPKNGC